VTYARLLRRLHEFIRKEQRETPEAEAIADGMDKPWLLLTQEERERVGGLAEDLYALADGNRKAIEMTPQETQVWQAEAKKLHQSMPFDLDADAALAFLRKPHPSGLPAGVIPFLQGRSWERLGDHDTALVFFREAARQDPGYLDAVISTLLNLRRYDEALQESQGLIRAPGSGPEELFVATAPLLAVAKGKAPDEARRLFEQVADALTRADQLLSRAPAGARYPPHSEFRRYVLAALALSLRELGRQGEALEVIDRAVRQLPDEIDLLALRGHLRYETDIKRGLSDFAEAARRGTTEFWPYFFLARHALQQRAWALALRYAIRASELPAEAAARAEAYEAIAIAQAELGQPADVVLQNFELAASLAPSNERIRSNLEIARSRLTAQEDFGPPTEALHFPPDPAARFSRRRIDWSSRGAISPDRRAEEALSTVST
jgi:tetratricopeptide (TPR) repeat protein